MHAKGTRTNVEDTCWNPRDRDEGVVGKRLRGLLEPEWAGKKRIETLGFSLETDDACGSLRMRDYGRQLEIRSKQMDCENTLSLSLPLSPSDARARARTHIHRRSACMYALSRFRTPLSLSLPLTLSLSSLLAPHACHSPAGGYKRLGPLMCRFSCIYTKARSVIPLLPWQSKGAI